MYYSEKFRKEVMEYIDGGHTQIAVAKMFKISAKTVWNWCKQRNEKGHLKPNTSYDRAPRKLPKGALLQYIKEHPDAYLREIATYFNCCASSVSARLEKLGVSYKKNSFVQGERRKETSRISRRIKQNR